MRINIQKLTRFVEAQIWAKMAEVLENLENAQRHVSEAEYELKVALSNLLKRGGADDKISVLRDAHRKLQEVYRMIEGVKNTL